MGEIEVCEVTASDVGGPTFAAAAEVLRIAAAEDDPDDPPLGPEEVALELFQVPARKRVRSLVATLDGAPAGVLLFDLPQLANREQVGAYAQVVPAARRRGVAAALAARAVDVVRRDHPERTTVSSWVDVGAGGDWCERLGLTFRQEERMSRLRVADVDLHQQRRWEDEAPARERGYRVVTWRGPCPEEHLAALCVAYDAMADAPLDDVDHEFHAVRPEHVRDGERAAEGKRDPFRALALGPDGEAAGLTELGVNVHRPALGDQGDTAVVAAHRGHGLGRWLKAANLAQARRAHPALATVDTFNAASNPWMLAINVAMGFRPHRAYRCHQGPLPDLG